MMAFPFSICLSCRRAFEPPLPKERLLPAVLAGLMALVGLPLEALSISRKPENMTFCSSQEAVLEAGGPCVNNDGCPRG